MQSIGADGRGVDTVFANNRFPCTAAFFKETINISIVADGYGLVHSLCGFYPIGVCLFGLSVFYLNEVDESLWISRSGKLLCSGNSILPKSLCSAMWLDCSFSDLTRKCFWHIFHRLVSTGAEYFLLLCESVGNFKAKIPSYFPAFQLVFKVSNFVTGLDALLARNRRHIWKRTKNVIGAMLVFCFISSAISSARSSLCSDWNLIFLTLVSEYVGVITCRHGWLTRVLEVYLSDD